MQNIVMVGAGAMGCLFAARLALAGNAVTVVDVDPARLALINAEGIVIEDDAGRHVARVCAARADEVSGPVDLLMLFTKGMHSAAAIRSVAHLESTGCIVLTLQNGLGNVEAIAEVFPADRIAWGVTDFPADLESGNHVASHGQGHIFLGNWPHGADARAGGIAALLSAAGLNAVADPEVPIAVWEKVAFNAALNALCTVSGLPVGGLDHPAGRRAARTVTAEIAAIAKAEGIQIDTVRLAGKVDFAIANHTHHKPSMLQDRLAGRPTEIESINGALLGFAAHHGVAAPALALLTDLVRLGEGAV
jgi:2-dehydropantoate 2-reductase